MDLDDVRTQIFPALYGPGENYLADSMVDQKRAVRIARTELTRALNESIMIGLKNIGVTKAIS